MDPPRHFLYDSRMSMPRIPVWSLFGESADLAEVVHVETIEARSRLHDWTLEAHRHARLHQILHLDAGAGQVSLEGVLHPLEPGCFVNLPMGVVHGFTFRPDTGGLVVTFAAELLDQSLRPAEGLREVLARPAVLAQAPGLGAALAALQAAHASRAPARAMELRALSALALARIARALAGAGASPAQPGASDLLARFEALLDRHLTDHWGVADYAAALAVSAPHLSRLTRAATGRPASGLIEDRLIREARRHLVFTDLPVSRIAYALGFEDPAYFTRVFTRATGTSPRAFRQRLGAG